MGRTTNKSVKYWSALYPKTPIFWETGFEVRKLTSKCGLSEISHLQVR
jgi:hypothetical protein